MSKARRWPNGVSDRSISPGLAARIVSMLMSDRVSAPQSSISTSAESSNWRRVEIPSPDRLSSTTLRFPILRCRNSVLASDSLTSGKRGSEARVRSPFGAGSTLITSAPNAASIRPQNGPATPPATSTTLMPWSGEAVTAPYSRPLTTPSIRRFSISGSDSPSVSRSTSSVCSPSSGG